MRLNFTFHDFFPTGVSVPPSLSTVSPAVRTATMWGQFVALFALTDTIGAPNCSTVCVRGGNVYTTLLPGVRLCSALRETLNRFAFGTVVKLVAARHGLLATWTGFSLSTPFGSSLRKRSYQRNERSTMCAMSGPGKLDGEWPKSPTESRFGPASRPHAAVA